MLSNPEHAQRVREYQRKRQTQPASLTDIAFDTGVLAERERIVKLLEDNIGHGDPDGDSYFMDAIALINEPEQCSCDPCKAQDQ